MTVSTRAWQWTYRPVHKYSHLLPVHYGGKHSPLEQVQLLLANWHGAAWFLRGLPQQVLVDWAHLAAPYP